MHPETLSQLTALSKQMRHYAQEHPLNLDEDSLNLDEGLQKLIRPYCQSLYCEDVFLRLTLTLDTSDEQGLRYWHLSCSDLYHRLLPDNLVNRLISLFLGGRDGLKELPSEYGEAVRQFLKPVGGACGPSLPEAPDELSF